jgi:hypothetical protein
MVTRVHKLADRLDSAAAVPGYQINADLAAAAARELQAEAEHDQSEQSVAVLRLLPRINAALQSRDALEMNRLAVELRAIQ